MTRIFLPLVALLAMLGCAQAQSALRWDKKIIELQPGSSEKTARADFAFTNIGNQPVTIESVKSSCGCTTVGLEKKTYQPGEKGRITGVFTMGSRKGDQVKSIRVNVRGETDPIVLTMVTHIGEAIKLEPSLVFWRAGEAPRAKIINVKLPDGMRITRVTSSDPAITATLETTGEKGECKITVTPEATSRKTMAVLNIQGVNRSNEQRMLQAFALIKAP